IALAKNSPGVLPATTHGSNGGAVNDPSPTGNGRKLQLTSPSVDVLSGGSEACRSLYPATRLVPSAGLIASAVSDPSCTYTSSPRVASSGVPRSGDGRIGTIAGGTPGTIGAPAFDGGRGYSASMAALERHSKRTRSATISRRHGQ